MEPRVDAIFLRVTSFISYRSFNLSVTGSVRQGCTCCKACVSLSGLSLSGALSLDVEPQSLCCVDVTCRDATCGECRWFPAHTLLSPLSHISLISLACPIAHVVRLSTSPCGVATAYWHRVVSRMLGSWQALQRSIGRASFSLPLSHDVTGVLFSPRPFSDPFSVPVVCARPLRAPWSPPYASSLPPARWSLRLPRHPHRNLSPGDATLSFP